MAKDFRTAEPTVKKVGYAVTMPILGTDEQGRTLVQCPNRGCGDTAYIAEDGRVVCPTGEADNAAMAALFAAALPELEALALGGSNG